MKILILTNLFPPHHAGSFDLRCQTVAEVMRQRGHEIRVLTSTHGLRSEQRDAEIERRLQLNGAFAYSRDTNYRTLKQRETHNHACLRETIADYQPELIFVWSLEGLSKSLIFGIRNSRVPSVYDVGDLWMAHGIREDPWLRYWNGVKIPEAGGGMRTLRTLFGARQRLDRTAPTRMMRGYERLPNVYGPPDALAHVAPNSVTGFRFERLYFCSQYLKSATEHAGFRVNDAEVIYPGVATHLYFGEVKPPSAAMERFLIVSRLDERSGIMTALNALAVAKQSKLNVRLTICGRGDSDYVAQLRSHALNHGLPVEFVTAANEASDLPKLLRKHDVLIHSSEDHEPYAQIPLQAMACGLPVIGTATGGSAELLRHGESALTYSPGDSEELVERMAEIQIEPALRCQIAETGMTEAQTRYNQADVIDRAEGYLNESLEYWQQLLLS